MIKEERKKWEILSQPSILVKRKTARAVILTPIEPETSTGYQLKNIWLVWLPVKKYNNKKIGKRYIAKLSESVQM